MKKYGNDYRQRGKKFEYTGKWYGSSLSVKELKRHALNNTGLMAAALVIYFASLMLNNEGSRIFWILLPYMVVVFPVSYGIMGGASLFLFCRQQEGKADHSQVVIPEEHIGHMTCAQYEKGVRRPVRCSIAITVLGLFTSVANLIFLLKDFENLIFTRELLLRKTGGLKRNLQILSENLSVFDNYGQNSRHISPYSYCTCNKTW